MPTGSTGCARSVAALGSSPRKDLDSYKRIGVIAGADALVVVHREGDILIEVFDVSAAQFYEGALGFGNSSTEERVEFIRSRAEQAQLRWAAPPPPPPPVAAKKVNEPEKPADESQGETQDQEGLAVLGGRSAPRRRCDLPHNRSTSH